MEETPTSQYEFLESQLAQVVEQDGMLLNTPHGVRKKKVKSQKSKVTATSDARRTTRDDVASLDHDTVNVILAKSGGVAHAVPIRFEKHARSPFVVSLQRVLLSSSSATRRESLGPLGFARDTQRMLYIESRPVEAYATVSTDLVADADPWVTATQFTPPSFDEAYREVYGRFDRTRRVFSDAASLVAGLFQRVERIETEAVEDVKEAMGVVEVRQFSFVRALAAFAGLALVVTLPANAVALYRSVSSVKDAASAEGSAAVNDLVAATKSATLPESADALRRASSRFRAVDGLLTDANALAVGAASVASSKYRSARALAEVGDKSSEAARIIALGLDKVFADPGRRLDERLDVLGAYARSALTLLSDASKAAATVDASSLPAPHQDEVKKLLVKLSDSTDAVREFASLADVLSALAGKDGFRNYLLIFQNNTELRPTGGFMGSFAEVRMDRGVVQSVRVPGGGTYDLKGQLLARVTPPEPLELVANRWQFQDANWSPDFPTSAEKIKWFWSKAGQPTVDGIIAVNASFVEHLLALTGPIDLPAYGKTIDASNFMSETQKAVEIDYDHAANTPKKFIGDLAAKLLERLKSLKKDQWLSVASLVSDALETKDIQLALSRPDEEALAERYGWNGRMKDGTGDELALVEANVAGQKTDGVVAESTVQNVDIGTDGSIRNTVTLTRTHNGKKGELFSGVRNVSYLRAYVPKGSILISASGFNAPDPKLFKPPDDTTRPDPDIAQSEATAHETPDGVTVATEGSRTVFGGWMQLDPGETQTVTLTYRLPMTVNEIAEKLDAAPERPASENPSSAYLLLLTSQSGKTSRQIATTVTYPKGWGVSWSRPQELVTKGNSVIFSSAWDRDRAIALLFTPHVQTSEALVPSP